MNIQKLIGTVALFIALHTTYELVATSRVTFVTGKMTTMIAFSAL
jgi:hypothetical protein